MVKIASWLSDRERLNSLFFLLFLFLPTQLGKHFFPPFSTVLGIRIDYLSPTLYLTDLLILSAIGSGFFSVTYRQYLRMLVDRHQLLLGVGLLTLLISSYQAENVFLSLYGVLKIVEVMLLAVTLVWYFRTVKNSYQSLTTALSIGLCVESVLALWQYLGQRSVNGLWYFLGERFFTPTTPGIALASINGELLLRPYGTFPHPNVLAGCIVVSQILIYVHTKKKSWITWVILILSTGTLFLTMSRLAVLLWCFLVMVLLLRKKIWWWLVAPVIAVGVLFLPVAQRFSFVSLLGESTQIRLSLIAASWQMIQQHVLFGVGPLHFIPTLANTTYHLPTLFSLQPVHAIFMLLFAEVGFVGGVVFSIVLVRGLLVGVRVIRDSPYKLILLLAFILLGVGDHYLFTVQQGQLFTALLFSQVFASPRVLFHKGRQGFNYGLRKNSRKVND